MVAFQVLIVLKNFKRSFLKEKFNKPREYQWKFFFFYDGTCLPK